MLESILIDWPVLPFSTQTSFSKLLQTTNSFSLLSSLYMINPFNSNNDQFLFRKNYQLLTRHEQPQPTPLRSLQTNDSTLRSLHYRNPFTSHSPKIYLKNSSVTSPTKPQSLSRSNAQSITMFGNKGGLLESADRWKREIENQERQKLHLYGAEGLRYNAFTEQKFPPQNEYYKTEKHPENVRIPSFQKLPSGDPVQDYYQSPKIQVLPQRTAARQSRQKFQDEVFQSPNFHLHDPRKRDSNSLSETSRNSKINDMFQSLDERFKRSMQYNSYYGGTPQEQMLQSKKGGFQGSRFKESGSKFRQSEKYKDTGLKFRESLSRNRESSPNHIYRGMSMQSQVDKFEAPAPRTIQVQGQLYYRIHF